MELHPIRRVIDIATNTKTKVIVGAGAFVAATVGIDHNQHNKGLEAGSLVAGFGLGAALDYGLRNTEFHTTVGGVEHTEHATFVRVLFDSVTGLGAGVTIYSSIKYGIPPEFPLFFTSLHAGGMVEPAQKLANRVHDVFTAPRD